MLVRSCKFIFGHATVNDTILMQSSKECLHYLDASYSPSVTYSIVRFQESLLVTLAHQALRFGRFSNSGPSPAR